MFTEDKLQNDGHLNKPNMIVFIEFECEHNDIVGGFFEIRVRSDVFDEGEQLPILAKHSFLSYTKLIK